MLKKITKVMLMAGCGVFLLCAGTKNVYAAEGTGTVTAAGPVACWHLDEGTGTTSADATGQGHDVQFREGHEPQWVEGFLGKALEFGKKSKGQCRIKDSRAMNYEQFTIEAWVFKKQEEVSSDPVVQAKTRKQEIITKSDDNSQCGGFRLRYDYGALELIVSDGVKQDYCVDRKKGLILPDVWTHIAGSYDGKTARVYINGELVAELDYAKPCKPNKNQIEMGAHSNGEVYLFEGIIDEVYIYNGARSKDVIFNSMLEQSKKRNEQKK